LLAQNINYNTSYCSFFMTLFQRNVTPSKFNVQNCVYLIMSLDFIFCINVCRLFLINQYSIVKQARIKLILDNTRSAVLHKYFWSRAMHLFSKYKVISLIFLKENIIYFPISFYFNVSYSSECFLRHIRHFRLSFYRNLIQFFTAAEYSLWLSLTATDVNIVLPQQTLFGSP
jgi:hypothetical protein